MRNINLNTLEKNGANCGVIKKLRRLFGKNLIAVTFENAVRASRVTWLGCTFEFLALSKADGEELYSVWQWLYVESFWDDVPVDQARAFAFVTVWKYYLLQLIGAKP